MTVLETVLRSAADELAPRLRAPGPVSEDLFRYIVFAEMLAHGASIERLALEYPHPTMKGAEVDTVLLGHEGSVDLALEFKYHRRNPSGANLPRPQLAGGLLRDIARLAAIDCRERALVYLTDGEMFDYLRSASNGLTWLVDPEPGRVTSIGPGHLAARSATLRQAAGPWPPEVKLVTIGQWRVQSDHRLMGWRVEVAGH